MLIRVKEYKNKLKDDKIYEEIWNKTVSCCGCKFYDCNAGYGCSFGR